jgi:hypothetical protein
MTSLEPAFGQKALADESKLTALKTAAKTGLSHRIAAQRLLMVLRQDPSISEINRPQRKQYDLCTLRRMYMIASSGLCRPNRQRTFNILFPSSLDAGPASSKLPENKDFQKRYKGKSLSSLAANVSSRRSGGGNKIWLSQNSNCIFSPLGVFGQWPTSSKS